MAARMSAHRFAEKPAKRASSVRAIAVGRDLLTRFDGDNAKRCRCLSC